MYLEIIIDAIYCCCVNDHCKFIDEILAQACANSVIYGSNWAIVYKNN